MTVSEINPNVRFASDAVLSIPSVWSRARDCRLIYLLQGQLLFECEDKEYEILLTKKTVLFSGFGISVGIVKFINVCLHSKIQLIFTDPSNITMPTITAPSLPWFSTLVFFLTLIYVLYSFYYFGFVKTELNETAKHL